jgi:psiF repeat
MIRSIVFSALLLSVAATAPVLAEDAPAGGKPPAAQMSTPEKQAIAKSCTDQANAKGLHGKARKKFRSACKKKGGKVE